MTEAGSKKRKRSQSGTRGSERGKGTEDERIGRGSRSGGGKSELAELRREVGYMGETIRALGQEVLKLKLAVLDGFKKNRREIRQFRELLDSDWEEYSEGSESGGGNGEEEEEGMKEVKEELRELRRGWRRGRRAEMWRKWMGSEEEQEVEERRRKESESEEEIDEVMRSIGDESGGESGSGDEE